LPLVAIGTPSRRYAFSGQERAVVLRSIAMQGKFRCPSEATYPYRHVRKLEAEMNRCLFGLPHTTASLTMDSPSAFLLRRLPKVHFAYFFSCVLFGE